MGEDHRSMYEEFYVEHNNVEVYKVPKEQARPQLRFESTSTSRAHFRPADYPAPAAATRFGRMPGKTVIGAAFYGSSETQSRLEEAMAMRAKPRVLPPLASCSKIGSGSEGSHERVKRDFSVETETKGAFAAFSPEAARDARGRRASRRCKRATHGQGLGLGGMGQSRYTRDFTPPPVLDPPRAVRCKQLPMCYAAERWGGRFRSTGRVARPWGGSSAGRGSPFGPSVRHGL
eukprot:Hpha_TRINITY_DN16156_c5_g2::TRINITY_DN16156_c5_g2_i1::g.3490::m.3490